VVKKSNEEAINLIEKADLEIKNLKNIIFGRNILKFKIAPFNDSILGKLNTDRPIDSLILSKLGQQKKFRLIYRAS
jgi:hypothetical protein